MAAGRSKLIAVALGVLLLIAVAILILITFFPTTTAPPVQRVPEGRRHEHDHGTHSRDSHIPDRIFEPEQLFVEVHGTVYEPDGSVAIGVEVRASRRNKTLAVARTDKEGTYKLEQVPAGQTTFIASTPEYPTLSESIWLKPDESPVRVDLRFKGTGEIFGIVSDYEKGFSLRGVGIKLRSLQSNAVLHATSDAVGTYVFKNLQPGEYGLSARLDGYAPYFMGGEFTIVLDKEKVQRDIELEIACKISGVVTDPQGNPVAAGSVTFEHFSTRTSSAGYYELDIPPSLGFRVKGEDPPPGFVFLTVRAEGFAPATPDPIQVVPGDWIRVDVQLSRGGRVFGRVMDEDGNLMSGVRIAITKTWYNEHVFSGEAVTGPDGAYEIPHVGAGQHVVEASPGGMPSSYKKAELDECGEREVDFTLERRALIEGIVVGSDDQPLEGVTIMSLSPHGWAQTLTGEDGCFNLTGLPPDEPCRLSVVMHGYQFLQLEDITPGTKPLVIKLLRTAGLSGRVTLDGVGQRGVKVYMWVEKDPSLRWMKTTSQDGKFEFKDMNPGKYRIVAETEGYRSGAQTIELGAGVEKKEAVPVELKLEPVE